MKKTDNTMKRDMTAVTCGLQENVLEEGFKALSGGWEGLAPLGELALKGTLFGQITNGIRTTYDIDIRIKRLEETAPPDQKWQITLASIEGSILATGYAFFAEAQLARLTAVVAATQGLDAAFATWYLGQVVIAKSSGELAEDWTALSYQWISTGTLGGETFQTIRNDVKGIKHYSLDQDCNGVKVVSYTGHRGDQKALSWGDPHLITFDGLQYDLQQPGELILAESTDLTHPLEIQVRHEPWHKNPKVSVNTAVATGLNNTKLGFYLPPRNVTTSSEENDIIIAPNTTSTLVYGGEDTGTAQVFTNASATFTSTSSGNGNVFGYYVGNGTAPLSGKVVVANGNAANAAGTSITFPPETPQGQVGYFMIPGGYMQQNIDAGLAQPRFCH